MLASLVSLILSLGIYTNSGIITTVDYDTDTVVFEDYTGNEWSFEGCEDWCEGDHISCMMYGNETPEIYDDVILTVNYDG